MPRMSEAEKRKSHHRILDAAADLFRAQGIENTSVSEVMKAAGMTHGGFYRHFGGKDDLVAAAFEHAVSQVIGSVETAQDMQARAKARAAYIDTYLTAEHANDLQNGCPMAALGSELVRAHGDTATRTAEAVDRVSGILQDGAADTMADARLALLLGAITLARLSGDAERSAAILNSARTAMERL